MGTEQAWKILAATAHAWCDPDYAPRATAVAATLAAGNRFTEEALAYALNQQMHLVNRAALERWIAGRVTATPVPVGVLGAGNVPLAAFQDYLAVTATGHEFVGHESSRSPWLLKAFADDVAARGGPRASFVGRDDVFTRCLALIASGTDETVARIADRCDDAGMAPTRRLLRATRFGVAILDGRESEDQRVRWAEDVLLHEGLGCRNVAVTFAPDGLDADPYLEALAVFRGTFPSHEETRGTLKMQQAFLKAVQMPHAYGDGLEFLVSRGDPDPQPPGHLRWTSYSDEAVVTDWLWQHRERIQIVACRPALLRLVPEPVDRCALGDTQRPPLDWRPDGVDTVDFLSGLSIG